MKLFNENRINDGRQLEIDIDRGLAVIVMIAVHVLETFSKDSVQNSLFGYVIEFLGSPPAAPVFMFILGVGIIYSRKSSAGYLLKRGMVLFTAGFLLNILRGVLPGLIGFFVEGNKEYLYVSLSEFLSIDILQLAGLSFVFFAAVYRFKINRASLLLIGVIFGVLNLFIKGIEIENYILSNISGLIWGSNELSYFPFLTWIIYPISGFLFGSFLIKVNNKRLLYRYIFWISLIVTLSFSLISLYFFKIDLGINDSYGYYHHGIFGNIVLLSFVLFWISSTFFLSFLVKGHFRNILERWSKNVSTIYFIHWIIIGWLSIVLHSFGYLATIILFFIISILSDFLSVIYLKKSQESERISPEN